MIFWVVLLLALFVDVVAVNDNVIVNFMDLDMILFLFFGLEWFAVVMPQKTSRIQRTKNYSKLYMGSNKKSN